MAEWRKRAAAAPPAPRRSPRRARWRLACDVSWRRLRAERRAWRHRRFRCRAFRSPKRIGEVAEVALCELGIVDAKGFGQTPLGHIESAKHPVPESEGRGEVRIAALLGERVVPAV